MATDMDFDLDEAGDPAGHLGDFYYGPVPQLVTGPFTCGANKAGTTSVRVNYLVDNYLDVILHEFRQLRVWDEHPRRTTGNPKVLRLTYRNLNTCFVPEVWTMQNKQVPPAQVGVDYTNGLINVSTDTGNNDYFVTYDWNYFPSNELIAMLALVMEEINASVSDNGGFITNFINIDHTPTYWDAPLTLGVLAIALRRLAMDSQIWKNRLIWADGQNGPDFARQMAETYQTQFDDLRKSVKRLHLLARPTHAFQLFESVGFGFFAVDGGKFHGMRLNKLFTY